MDIELKVWLLAMTIAILLLTVIVITWSIGFWALPLGLLLGLLPKPITEWVIGRKW